MPRILIVFSHKTHYHYALPIQKYLKKNMWEVMNLFYKRRHEILSDVYFKFRIEFFVIKKIILQFFRIYSYFNLLFFYFKSFFSFFRKPDLILVMSDGSFPESIVLGLGKILNIPSLLLQAGAVIEGTDLPKKIHVSKIACMGEVSKKEYMKHGISEEKIVITGSPIFDKLPSITKLDRKFLFKKFSLDQNKKVILLATENFSIEFEKKRLKVVAKAVKSLKDTQLVVKIHPQEGINNIKEYKKIIQEIGIPPIIIKDIKFNSELIYLCDIFIALYTTLIFKALFFRKPVIIFRLLEEPIPVHFTGDPLYFAKNGVAISIFSEQELISTMKKIFLAKKTGLEKNIDNFLYNHCYKIDGKATERIINLIKELTKNQKSYKSI